MEDYQEQQEDEIEALKSIFDSDFTGLWKLPSGEGGMKCL